MNKGRLRIASTFSLEGVEEECRRSTSAPIILSRDTPCSVGCLTNAEITGSHGPVGFRQQKLSLRAGTSRTGSLPHRNGPSSQESCHSKNVSDFSSELMAPVLGRVSPVLSSRSAWYQKSCSRPSGWPANSQS